MLLVNSYFLRFLVACLQCVEFVCALVACSYCFVVVYGCFFVGLRCVCMFDLFAFVVLLFGYLLVSLGWIGLLDLVSCFV